MYNSIIMVLLPLLLCCECGYVDDECIAIVSSCTSSLAERYAEIRHRCSVALSILCELRAGVRIPHVGARIREYVIFRSRGDDRLAHFTHIWNVVCRNFQSLESVDRQELVNLRYLSNLNEFLQIGVIDYIFRIRDPREKSPGPQWEYARGQWRVSALA